jgi:antitoxin (DNA-binding transcriptional repressor) of toxin-antitoxin stability system
LRITRHGIPVAEVIPAGPDRKRKFVGDMVGTGTIVGDIVSPVIDLDEIEAYHD